MSVPAAVPGGGVQTPSDLAVDHDRQQLTIPIDLDPIMHRRHQSTWVVEGGVHLRACDPVA